MKITSINLKLFVFYVTVLLLNNGLEAAEIKDRDASAIETAKLLVEAFEQIQVNPDESSYNKYFAVYPASFEEIRELFTTEKYTDILYTDESYKSWEYGFKYQIEMCRTYEYINHKKYLRKIIDIGIQANDWGGVEKKELYIAGDIFKRLLSGQDCMPQTGENYEERSALAIEVLSDLSVSEVEKYYIAISWYDGTQFIPAIGFLKKVCEYDSSKCKLVDKYQK